MKRRKIVLITLSAIATILIAIIVNYLKPSDRNYISNYGNQIKFQRYEGEVVKKYYEQKSKNYPSLLLRNRFGDQVVILAFDKSGVFDFVEVGDSIFKRYGSLELTVKRNDLKSKFTLQFD